MKELREHRRGEVVDIVREIVDIVTKIVKMVTESVDIVADIAARVERKKAMRSGK